MTSALARVEVYGLFGVLLLGGTGLLISPAWVVLLLVVLVISVRQGLELGSRHTKLLESQWGTFPVEEDSEPSQEARLPTALLVNHDNRSVDNALPGQATALLAELQDEALRRESHEVLVLAARLFRDPRVPAMALQEVLEPMLEHTGVLLRRLGALQADVGTRTTAELLDGLARLDAQLLDAEDGEQTAGLIAERGQLLDEMARLDARVYEASLLRGHLLRVRAALLDLQQQFGGVALPSLEVVREEVLELTLRFEAEREVLELLEGV